MRIWLTHNWLRLGMALMLFYAVAVNPYVYYQLLRWVVCLGGLYCALQVHEISNGWMWAFIIGAILFNPIKPFCMEKETWQIVDLIVGLAVFASIFVVKFTEMKPITVKTSNNTFNGTKQ